MSGNNIFVWTMIGVIAWYLYMMTFRPEQFSELMRIDAERKKRQRETLGQAAKAGFKIARWFMKR